MILCASILSNKSFMEEATKCLFRTSLRSTHSTRMCFAHSEMDVCCLICHKLHWLPVIVLFIVLSGECCLSVVTQSTQLQQTWGRLARVNRCTQWFEGKWHCYLELDYIIQQWFNKVQTRLNWWHDKSSWTRSIYADSKRERSVINHTLQSSTSCWID